MKLLTKKKADEYSVFEKMVIDQQYWEAYIRSLEEMANPLFTSVFFAGARAGLRTAPVREALEGANLPDLKNKVVSEATQIALDQMVEIGIQVVAEKMHVWAQGIAAVTRDNIVSSLATARKNDLGSEYVLSRIKADFSPARAQRIAVTETTRFFGAGAQHVYKAAGIPGWEWQTVEDKWVCPTCSSKDNTQHPVDEDFSPAHVQCRCFPRPVTRFSQQIGGAQNVPDPAAPRKYKPMKEADLDDRASAVLNRLSTEQISDVTDYTEGYYQEINTWKRTGKLPDREFRARRVQEIDETMRGLIEPMDADTILYRGTKGLRGLDVGDDFIDEGWMSTSISRKVAESFHNDVLEIRVKSESGVIPIGRPLGLAGKREREVILPPGSKLRIVDKVEDAKGNYTFTAELDDAAALRKPVGGAQNVPDPGVPTDLTKSPMPKLIDNATGDRGNTTLATLAHEQGFDKTPRLVSRAEYDQMVARGEITPVYRGVTNAEAADAFKNGNAFYGSGIGSGDGIYVTPDRARALGYAGPDGHLLEMGYPKDYRMVAQDDIEKMTDSLRNEIRSTRDTSRMDWYSNDAGTSGVGVAKGFEGQLTRDEGVQVLWNRSRLVVVDESPVPDLGIEIDETWVTNIGDRDRAREVMRQRVESSPIQPEMHRGIVTDADSFERLRAADTLDIDDPTSFTSSLKTAEGFAEGGSRSRSVTITVNGHRGHAIPYDQFDRSTLNGDTAARMAHEQEIVSFGRFRIVDRQVDGNKMHLTVEPK